MLFYLLLSCKKQPLCQLDIQNYFLHGDLHETVYLRQLEGFIDSAKLNHVCLLHKSLYGLKQAPHAWFHRFSTALHILGFHASKTDPSLLIYSSKGILQCILVYLDDIILLWNSSSAIENIVHTLSHTFTLQDMGPLSFLWGLKISIKGMIFFYLKISTFLKYWGEHDYVMPN